MEDKSHCWDRMLDGTLDSIMMQILPDEVIPPSQQSTDDKDLEPTIALSSSTHCLGDEIDSSNMLEIDKRQLRNELSEVSSSWARLNADVAKVATVAKESLPVDIEILSHQLKEWGSRLVRLQTVIKPPSTPNIQEQEQVLYGRNTSSSSLNWDISHKEYEKGGGLSLASFQSSDDSNILSRIDHLKRTNYDDDESRSSCRAVRQVQLLPAAAQAATDNFQN